MSQLPNGTTGDLAERGVPELLRELHFARATGTLEIDAGEQKRRLYLRAGELYLAGSHPLARRLGEVVERLVEAEHPGSGHAARNAETLEAHRRCYDLVQRMAGVIAEWRHGAFRFTASAEALPGDLVGPLPTKRLLMLGASQTADPGEWLLRLGGKEAELVAAERLDGDVDALGLTPEESYLLERLRQPMRVAQLLDESPLEESEALRRLVQLCAVRLIRKLGTEASPEPPQESLDAQMTTRFLARFERDLEEHPLELPVEELRRRTADLLARLGAMDAYELLGLEPSASTEIVQASYEALARQVHPSNAKRYGLEPLESMLKMLFERATQSYLVLADSDRRHRYNEAQGITVAAGRVTGSQREAEEKSLGRQHYEKALALASRGEFHFAIELLQIAAKIDPRAEYFLALGRIQAKNPKWLKRAVDSCRAALELEPRNGEVRVFLGELYEHLGDLDRARVQYSAAARDDPNNLQAAAKARDLLPQRGEARRPGGLFDRIFRRPE